MKQLLCALLLVGLFFGCNPDESPNVDRDKPTNVSRQALIGHNFPGPVLINPNGAGENTFCNINIIFVAEGFQATEMGDFNSLADQARDALLSIEPFNGEENHINFYRVNSASHESGIGEIQFTDPDGCEVYNGGTLIYKNTAWGTYSNRHGLERYIGMAQDKRLLLEKNYSSYASNDYVYTVMITNTPGLWYASAEFPGIDEHDLFGGDAQVSNMAVSRYDDGFYFQWLVKHEFGHSFGAITDEYGDSGDGSSCLLHTYEPHFFVNGPTDNVQTSDPGGWHQGGYYENTGYWRSTENSIMRGDWNLPKVDWFSPIQREMLVAQFNAQASCEPVDFWEAYDEYYAGVELCIEDKDTGECDWEGIWTGTVREFTQSTWFNISGTYKFVLFRCNDFDDVNGWCNDIVSPPAHEIIITIP